MKEQLASKLRGVLIEDDDESDLMMTRTGRTRRRRFRWIDEDEHVGDGADVSGSESEECSKSGRVRRRKMKMRRKKARGNYSSAALAGVRICCRRTWIRFCCGRWRSWRFCKTVASERERNGGRN